MSDWKPYIHDRLIRKDPAGFFVIIPKDSEQALPLSCPVCQWLLRSRDDEAACIEFGCCHLCALQWAHARRAEWKTGWRPSPDTVKCAVAMRPLMSAVIDVG